MNSKKIIAFVVLMLIIGSMAIFFGCKKNKDKEESSSSVSDASSNSSTSSQLDASSFDNDKTNSSSKETSSPNSANNNIAKDSFELVLVNKDNRLTKDININLANFGGKQFDSRIVPNMKRMFNDASKDGCSLAVVSAYRTLEYQTGLFNKKVNHLISSGFSKDNAIIQAEKLLAPPGASEHCTGLATDIVNSSYFNNHTSLNEDFEDTKEFKWLSENAHKYGFILRYPKDKVAKTGYSYEPWHYRYVGNAAAESIYNSKICLEEYLK
ncbi:MAG: M15 family metallopeptidase [Clostridia bacterium]